MRNSVLILLFSLLTASSFAQLHRHAIGVRAGGGNYGAGGEVSYQLGLSDKNRLELDLGWRGNNGKGNSYNIFVFTAAYHWVWNIDGGLNWYVGPGAQIASWQHKKFDNESGTYIGVGGQLGIEYDFSEHDVPLQLSLDIRPMGFFSGNTGFGYGGAFAIRYLIE